MRRKEGLNEQPNPYGVNMSKTKMAIATLNTNTVSKSSADIVQESIGAGMDAAGGIWLVFRGSEGKGTGQQQVRGGELAELIAAVRDTVENGINDDEENLSAAEMFRRTFALREAPEGKTGQYCTFRLNNGKGAKPVTIPFDELGSFLISLKANAPKALLGIKGIKGVSPETVAEATRLAAEISE